MNDDDQEEIPEDSLIPTISQDDFKKAHVTTPVKRGGAPAGVSDKQRDAITAENKVKVWDMYVNGCTNQTKIAEAVGVPRSTVGRWLRDDLKQFADDNKELVEHHAQLDLKRMDKLLQILMRDVGTRLIDLKTSSIGEDKDGGGRVLNKVETHLLERVDVDIVDRIMKILERRAKQLGTDAKKDDEKNPFDLGELLDAVDEMRLGKLPKGFTLDAEFIVKEDDGEEEGQKEESGEEEGGQVDASPETKEEGQEEVDGKGGSGDRRPEDYDVPDFS